MDIFDVIVIGAGPSGMSVALNMLRYGKKVLLLEKENIGGQISKSPKVENLPSLKSISGIEFSNNFFDQLLSLNVCFKLEEVLKLKKEDNIFFVETNSNQYLGKTVVISVGVVPRKINIENEEKFVGSGISYCVMCDGFFFKDKNVCVIGDGNTALQYTLFLSNYCKNVYLCTLSEKMAADIFLIKKIKEKENIFIKNFFSIKEIVGDDEKKFLKEVKFLNLKQKTIESLNVQGLFIAIGQVPNNNIFKDLVSLKNGFIVVDENMQTNTTGLYAVGDCINKNVRQVATAVNDGCIASFFINRYLNNFN